LSMLIDGRSARAGRPIKTERPTATNATTVDRFTLFSSRTVSKLAIASASYPEERQAHGQRCEAGGQEEGGGVVLAGGDNAVHADEEAGLSSG